MTTFQLICLKCGSENVAINDIGSEYEFVCKDCDNWEADSK